jgi:hypothetical protein
LSTALILPVWLDNKDYYVKTVKFLEYYTQDTVLKALGITRNDIWLIDNASGSWSVNDIANKFSVNVKSYPKFLDRTAHLEYPYCWRCLYFARELFQEYDYTKVIHLNNDTYIVSPKLAEYIKNFKSGWWCPYCPRYNFPECDLQVVTADCDDYWQVTSVPYLKHNGKAMEHVIKAKAEKSWIGDRHGEYLAELPEGIDFSCQVRYPMKVEFK